MLAKQKETFAKATNTLEENGSKMLTTLEDYVNQNGQSKTTKIDWVCVCGLKKSSTPSAIQQASRCRSCNSQNKAQLLGTINVPSKKLFEEVLVKKGWVLIDEMPFINTKTLMKVICDNNHETQTSYNNGSRKDYNEFKVYIPLINYQYPRSLTQP